MEEATTLSTISSPTLIGRAKHLATLHQLIAQAKQGRAYTALITGEAGIGKSRLVAAAKTHAIAQGFLPLQGNCFPADITYPYAPMLDLLRSLAATNPSATLVTSLTTLARDIFPLLPELVTNQTIPLPSLEPEQEQRRLFAVLATFFRHLSTQSPLLLIIEDVHWSDDTSLDFLHYLIRRSTAWPILLLITYRHDELRPALISWLAQLDRERLSQEIQLASLSRSDIDTMLSTIFKPQHTSLDMRRYSHGQLLDTLYTLTEGNPFFVEEIISSLIASGDIFYQQGYWHHSSGSAISLPRSIQDAVQQRTAHISEPARQVLTLAAVAGRHFDFALLQQLIQHEEQQLLLIMKELLAAQLVVEESADRFAFKHALTRQAIYTQLLARERRLLHRSIAETIEQQATTTADTHLEDLAYHFYHASMWQKVIDYAQRAAEKALRLYSHRAALGYFTWVLEATDQLALPPAPLVYRVRGQSHEALGEFELAEHDYTLALAAARSVHDRALEWQSLVDLGFLWAERDYAQTENWFRQALALAQTLANPVLHAHSLNRIGNWHLNVDQPHEALRYHQQALTIFEQLQDERGIAGTLDLLGMTSYLSGDLIQGTVYYQRAIALFRKLEDQQGLTSSLATMTIRGPTYQTDSLISATSLAEARQDAEQALSIARQIGNRPSEAYALFQLGVCFGSQGEYGQALQTAQQSLDIAEEIEHRQWQTAAHFVLGGTYSNLLAYTQAYEHYQHALALAHEIGSSFWTHVVTGYLASIAILRHDLILAETLLHTALDADTPAQTLTQRMLWCASVELALAQEHPTHALAIIDQLIASTASATHEQGSLRILKLRGEALVALQRPLEAETAFKKAQEIASTQGVRSLQWRISIALGNLYQAQKRHTEAERAFASARTLIAELATTITDQPLQEQFLRQAISMLPQLPSPPQERSTKQTFGGLTSREREVAMLIAQGKSNQVIAETLIVTKRTVETHIANIMFKLGHTSRTQIALWAVETGLVSKAETEPSL